MGNKQVCIDCGKSKEDLEKLHKISTCKDFRYICDICYEFRRANVYNRCVCAKCEIIINVGDSYVSCSNKNCKCYHMCDKCEGHFYCKKCANNHIHKIDTQYRHIECVIM